MVCYNDIPLERFPFLFGLSGLEEIDVSMENDRMENEILQ